MQQTERKPLFNLGQLVATPGALMALEKSGQSPMDFLSRHVRGDWGDLPKEDREENNLSLRNGFRLLSSYRTTAGTTLLNALGKFIQSDERIILIEDTAEIQLPHANLVRFEARREQIGIPAVSIRELLRASLRHRVVWRVENFNVSEAEQTLRALASSFGGDPAATDVSRLLRLPGFRNHKYKNEFIVRAFQETDTVHRPGDFRVQDDSPESPRRVEDSSHQRGFEGGHRSQSEADWAYAKRALARGDSPEHVIQSIADYRAEDKADPLYYARLTVTKAQFSLKTSGQEPAASRRAVSQMDRDL